jgi:hypothetical protein
MEFSKKIIVNAPADKVWDILGKDFANIGTWSSAVFKSVANDALPSVNNSAVGGRYCDTSFGKISEEFIAYDDDKKTFSFKGVFSSKMFHSVVNSTGVTAINDNKTEVHFGPNIKLSFIGMLMSPMIRMMLGKAVDSILADLKYYVENGKPSPAKVASQKKN